MNAIIGILPSEREKAQDLEVAIKVKYEMDSANLKLLESNGDLCEAKTKSPLDSGESILNYATLRQIILDIFKQNNFFYLESALVAIQREILAQFAQILTLDLAIKKLEIFSDCVPQVRLKWSKND